MATTTIILQPLSPVATVAQFSAMTGIPVGTIRQRIAEGKYPIMPKTKTNERTQINMVAYYVSCAKAANLKLVTA